MSPRCLIHDVLNIVDNPAAEAGPLRDFREEDEPPIDELYREWRRDRGSTSLEADEKAVELLETALAAGASGEPVPDPFGLGRIAAEFERIVDRLKAAQAAKAPHAAADEAD